MRLPSGLLAAATCIVSASCISYESIGPPTRQLEVGAVLARLSQPDSTTIFESLQMLAVAPDAQSVYALDRLARRIYRVSVDGGLLAAFGSEGQGPDEIADAIAIRASGRGVWVLDGERGRFLLFSPDGELLETVAPGVPWTLGGAFAPVEDGLIFPDFSSFQSPGDDPALFARAPLSGDGFESLASSGSIPGELEPESTMESMMERQIGWLLTAVAPDEMRLVLNRSSPAVWSVRASDEGIADIMELRVPPQVQEMTERILERDRPPPGAELRPITGVHSVHGRLWVATGGIQAEMLAFSVPRSGSVSPTAVYPGSLRDQERIRDAVVIGDRLVAITETEVLWAALVGASDSGEDQADEDQAGDDPANEDPADGG